MKEWCGKFRQHPAHLYEHPLYGARVALVCRGVRTVESTLFPDNDTLPHLVLETTDSGFGRERI